MFTSATGFETLCGRWRKRPFVHAQDRLKDTKDTHREGENVSFVALTDAIVPWDFETEELTISKSDYVEQ